MKPIRLATLSVLLLAAFTARAESLVVNGSLNGSIANMDVPTGWTVLGGTPDTMDQTSNVGVSGWLSFGVAPTASPDGGTWVGLGINGSYIEQFGQSLNGLTVGQTYTVSWQAANFGVNNHDNSYLGSNAIGVLLDTFVVWWVLISVVAVIMESVESVHYHLNERLWQGRPPVTGRADVVGNVLRHGPDTLAGLALVLLDGWALLERKKTNFTS